MSQSSPQEQMKNYMNQFNGNAQKMFEPWTKLNQAFLKNAEMMTEFSLNTIKSYSEIGLKNMRQVSEIDSPESAENFKTNQAEMLNAISQQMLADAQRMTELGTSMHDEVMRVMGEVYGETNEQIQANMQKTADQASKTAQEYSANVSKMAEKATEQVSKAAGQASKAASYATNKNSSSTNASKSSTDSNSTSKSTSK